MNETVEQQSAGTKPAQRTPLGKRGKANTNDTKLRIIGNDTRVPILDVAAFNSFIG